MVYTLYRITYVVVLVAALAPLLLYPVPREEDRWALAVLIGLDVREIAATSSALWWSGRRSLRGWRRRRVAEEKGSQGKTTPKLKTDQGAKLAARLFPEPENRPWVEQAGLASLKPGLRSLLELVPEEACGTISMQIHWPTGVHCPYCGCQEVAIEDPLYRKHWHRYRFARYVARRRGVR